MYLGNSRMFLGKTTNDVVYGEWKAVAPTEATNGEYGVTGTTDYEVYCLEWVSSFNTLMVGGKFENIISGSEVILANSIARFDGDWKALTAANISASVTGATSGVRGGSLSQDLGVVRVIRDVPMGSGVPTSKFIIVAGDFSRAGIIYHPTSSTQDPPQTAQLELNIALYGLGSPGVTGWFNPGTISSPLRVNSEIYNISGVRYTNSLRTYSKVLICGDFTDVYISSISDFSPYLCTIYHNATTNVYGYGKIQSGIDGLISFNNALGPMLVYYGGSGNLSNDNPYYTIDDRGNVYELTYASPGNYDATEVQELSTILNSLPGAFLTRNVTEFTEEDSSLTRYLSTDPILVSYNENDYQVLNPNLVGNSVDTVFYNSGYHLVVGNISNQKPSTFYNLESGNEKPIRFPTNATGTKINAVVVDDNTGTVYVGGKFVFQDSDGNTAWNVAKFVPDASKLPT